MDEFTRAVREMRTAQKQYFLTKTNDALRIAKDWERKVDDMVASRAKPDQPQQLGMFG